MPSQSGTAGIVSSVQPISPLHQYRGWETCIEWEHTLLGVGTSPPRTTGQIPRKAFNLESRLHYAG